MIQTHSLRILKKREHVITVLSSLYSDGDVRLNWTPVTKNGATLKTGDIVSVRGKGRLKVSR
jgi:RNA-binding protein YlmH